VSCPLGTRKSFHQGKGSHITNLYTDLCLILILRIYCMVLRHRESVTFAFYWIVCVVFGFSTWPSPSLVQHIQNLLYFSLYYSGVSISIYTKVYKCAVFVYHCVTLVQTLCMWLGSMFVQGEVATDRLILLHSHPDFSYIINLHTNFNLLNAALLQLWWVITFLYSVLWNSSVHIYSLE